MKSATKKVLSTVLAASLLFPASGLYNHHAYAAVIDSDKQLQLHLENNTQDSSPKLLNVTTVGNPSFVKGRVGQAISISSTSSNKQYLSLGNQVQLGTSQNFSISFWVKASSVTGDPALISNKNWASGSNAGYVLALKGTTLKWNYNTQGGSRVDADIPGVVNGAWQHIVISHDRASGRVDFYKNGEPVAVSKAYGDYYNGITSAMSIGTRTGTLDSGLPTNIGNDGTGNYGIPLDAQLDEVMFINRAVTPEEVAEIYKEAPPVEVDTTFKGTLSFVGASATVQGSEFTENLDLRTPDMTGPIDTIKAEIAYDADKFDFVSATKATSVDSSVPGVLKLTLPGSGVYNVANPLEFAKSAVSKLTFKAKAQGGSGNLSVTKAEFYTGGAKYDNESLTALPKSVAINAKSDEDLNKDGHITVGDVALGEGLSESELTAIADHAAFMPYKRVVVIGMDGAGVSVTPDAPYWETSSSQKGKVGSLLNIPSIRKIIEGGAASYSAQSTLPSSSSPNWGAMISGVDYSKHLIDNDISGIYSYSETSQYPSMFKKLRAAIPTAKLAAFTTWSNIITGHIEPSVGVEGHSVSDEEDVAAFKQYVAEGKADDSSLIFFQLDDLDHAGHTYGFYTKKYFEQLNSMDHLVGDIYGALEDRGLLEDTLILMATDHGGGTENANGTLGSSTSHGQDSPLAKTTFIAANGRTVAKDTGKEKILQGGTTKDIAATVLTALNVNEPIGDSKTINGMFVPQTEQNDASAGNLTLVKLTDPASQQPTAYELTVDDADVKALDVTIDTNGLDFSSVIPAQDGVKIIRQETEDGKARLILKSDETIAANKPIIRMNLAPGASAASAQLTQAMAADEAGKETMPNLKLASQEDGGEVDPPITDGPQTSLSGSSSVTAGSSFAVRVGLNTGENNVYAQDITLSYDPALMEFDSAKSLADGVELLETDESKPGEIRFLLASEGPDHSMKGAEDVIEVTFKASDVTQTSTGHIAVKSALVSDGDGKETAASVSSHAVTIQAKPAADANDINGDGKVSIGDLAIISAQYGKTSAAADWQQVARADVNKDGVIDILDMILVAKKIIE
ncbi:LamG-like jellyroll fold domain-containing protein [Paenibacillus glycanilyticus]|uniref:Dockerin domain-containing protein n=1 Tax=Paenibacillus glycanilyticus TaxID=126569 RepID=A0ABQ6GC86_9BACL|nr:cohesin domain-containing protein [Paenibacillus glycanilyticus]GLX67191.1 hypothetical protein MU1_15360 [Paenibacillus glycanilyticus]